MTNRSSRIKITPFYLLLAFILLLGIFARIWEFSTLPPGLNQDEASSGVDAFSLYRFGVDRNGVSFPVHFISWGSGQNALYAYLLIPFIALGGLTPVTVRLPMVLSGILTLPLVCFVAKRTMGEKFALISTFLVAISPWHILLSRWGLESNFLPFVFLLGYACLLKSARDNNWFITANLFFALCLYAYGTAYVAVPAFLVCAVTILHRLGKISIRNLILGLILFVIVSLPIGLFILVNKLQWSSLHLGIFTIPRLPSEPRYEGLVALFRTSPLSAMADNLLSMLRLLGKQTDGLIWNTVEPYGYLYTFTLPLAVIGVVQLIRFREADHLAERLLLVAWLAASLIIGILQPVNTNRMNLIFIPLILCVATTLLCIGKHLKMVFNLALCLFLICFTAFTYAYHGQDYRRQANMAFFAGLLPALDFARQVEDLPICVTETVNMPYIFALFSEQMNPELYLKGMEYVHPTEPFRKVRSVGRYTFGLQGDAHDCRTIYILREEKPPCADFNYKILPFDNYRLYLPRTGG